MTKTRLHRRGQQGAGEVKVHRMISSYYSACGAKVGRIYAGKRADRRSAQWERMFVPNVTWPFVPAGAQCKACDEEFSCSALPDHIAAVETALHLLARSDADLSAPHAAHWHVWLPYKHGADFIDAKLNPYRCPCGAFSRDGKSINGERTDSEWRRALNHYLDEHPEADPLA